LYIVNKEIRVIHISQICILGDICIPVAARVIDI
jgi:hypothetical protein